MRLEHALENWTNGGICWSRLGYHGNYHDTPGSSNQPPKQLGAIGKLEELRKWVEIGGLG